MLFEALGRHFLIHITIIEFTEVKKNIKKYKFVSVSQNIHRGPLDKSHM